MTGTHSTDFREREHVRLVRQFLLIAGISFLGEGLKALIPFPIPASVYGLVLMFSALTLGIVKPHQVRDAAKFLIEIMPLLFIPAAVGLLNAWDELKPFLLPVGVITVVSTVVVMAVTGRVTQAVIRQDGKGEGE
jgi:holin-like protein